MRKAGSLFLFLALNSGSAKAMDFLSPPMGDTSGICWQSFDEPFELQKSIYSKWPKIADPKQALPESTKSRVLSHPKVKELKASYKDGEGMAFDFFYLGQKLSHKGEYIQRAFLIKIIQLIFPKAKIVKRDYNTRFIRLHPINPSPKVYIPLEIKDVREFKKLKDEQKFEEYLHRYKRTLDMILLKMANSSQKGLLDEYKASFPSFKKNSVLSLYLPEEFLNYFFKNAPEETLDLFDILDHFISIGFHKVFLSSHFNIMLSKERKHQFLSTLLNYFDKILFLSRVSPEELFQIQDQDKVLFFNDLTGYIPVLHSLADIAFILGPLNILEGLFLDSKVIFMNKESFMQKGYSLAFDQLQQIALKTNRAVHIEDLKEVESAVQTLHQLSQKPLIYPDELVLDPKKGSALNQLLERLHFQITTANK